LIPKWNQLGSEKGTVPATEIGEEENLQIESRRSD
jgi:hypothetical protein